eukprot:928555_1
MRVSKTVAELPNGQLLSTTSQLKTKCAPSSWDLDKHPNFLLESEAQDNIGSPKEQCTFDFSKALQNLKDYYEGELTTCRKDSKNRCEALEKKLKDVCVSSINSECDVKHLVDDGAQERENIPDRSVLVKENQVQNTFSFDEYRKVLPGENSDSLKVKLKDRNHLLQQLRCELEACKSRHKQEIEKLRESESGSSREMIDGIRAENKELQDKLNDLNEQDTSFNSEKIELTEKIKSLRNEEEQVGKSRSLITELYRVVDDQKIVITGLEGRIKRSETREQDLIRQHGENSGNESKHLKDGVHEKSSQIFSVQEEISRAKRLREDTQAEIISLRSELGNLNLKTSFESNSVNTSKEMNEKNPSLRQASHAEVNSLNSRTQRTTYPHSTTSFDSLSAMSNLVKGTPLLNTRTSSRTSHYNDMRRNPQRVSASAPFATSIVREGVIDTTEEESRAVQLLKERDILNDSLMKLPTRSKTKADIQERSRITGRLQSIQIEIDRLNR